MWLSKEVLVDVTQERCLVEVKESYLIEDSDLAFTPLPYQASPSPTHRYSLNLLPKPLPLTPTSQHGDEKSDAGSTESMADNSGRLTAYFYFLRMGQNLKKTVSLQNTLTDHIV